MSVEGGPDIVNDGLVLYLDAGNIKSYPGSGTVWKDLSGNGNDGTLVNGVGYSSDNNGSFNYDGTNDYIYFRSSSNTENIALVSNFSIEQVFKPTDYQDQKYFKLTNVLFYRGNMTVYNYQVQITDSTTLTFTKRGTTENLKFHNFTVPDMTNKVIHSVFVIDSNTTIKCYVNGEYIDSLSVDGTPIENFTYNVPFGIGRGIAVANDLPFIGKYYLARMYNKTLSDDEILQNYKATKGRYGL